jgi:predicted nuclease of predicted toxin-antitoxin system
MVILDENLPASWEKFLWRFNTTANHWTKIGKQGDADEILLNYAIEHNAIIITQDLDFTRLLALHGGRLPSVIQLRVDCPSPQFVGEAVVSVLQIYKEQLALGCLISIDPSRNRLRLLPLR